MSRPSHCQAEDIRKQMLADINAVPGTGSTWNEARESLGYPGVVRDFIVIGFAAPSSGCEGSSATRRAA